MQDELVDVSLKIDKTTQLSLSDIFCRQTLSALTYISNSNDISLGFLLPPLLTSMASLLDKSTVTVADHTEKFIFYTGLVSYPSTGKTSSLKIFRDAIYDIEELNGVQPQASRIENGASFGILAELLTKNRSIISLENHGCLFLDSMTAGEKSGMVDLFGGYSFNGVVKTKRAYTRDPVLNICLASGPTLIVRELEKERRGYHHSGSGCSTSAHLSPFLFFAPMPSFTRRREFFQQLHVKQQKTEQLLCPPFTARAILYFLSEVNKLELSLAFDELAINEYFEFYKKTRQIAKRAAQWDQFIHSLYDKAGVFLVRLCGLIHFLNMAVDALSEVADSGKRMLTNEFLVGVQERVASLDKQQCSLIDIDTVRGSINLINYLIKTKLILADYELDFDSSKSVHELVLAYVSDFDPTRSDHEFQKMMKGIVNSKSV